MSNLTKQDPVTSELLLELALYKKALQIGAKDLHEWKQSFMGQYGDTHTDTLNIEFIISKWLNQAKEGK